MIEIIISLFFIVLSLCAFLFFINTHKSRDKTEILPSNFNSDYENIVIKTDDGINLDGWFIFSKGEKDLKYSVVIVCHGLGTNKSDLTELSSFLSNNNYHVLTFDFRGHGKSGGTKTSLGYLEQTDIKSAVDYLFTRTDVDHKRIGFFGLSMGASTGLQASSNDHRIKAVVSDSAYTSLYNQAKHEITKGYHLPWFPILNILNFFYIVVFKKSMKDISPQKNVSKISPRSILFIAGDKDERMTVDVARTLFNLANEPKELFFVKGATHGENLSVGGKVYKKRILEFFDKYLY